MRQAGRQAGFPTRFPDDLGKKRAPKVDTNKGLKWERPLRASEAKFRNLAG